MLCAPTPVVHLARLGASWDTPRGSVVRHLIVRATDRTMPASLELVAGNRLLASLPTADGERIAALLTPCHFRRGENISAPWEPLSEMTFPTSSVISVVAETSEGDSVEVGTIGREGMVGSTRLLDGGLSPLRVMCQIEGDALVGTAAALMEADVDGSLRSLALRYANTLLVQASITAACNRLHPLEQRAARWLLTISDRLDRPWFDLTHEFFAILLGAQRPSVTIAARELQHEGVITYRRGRVEITDRDGLEAATCGCYGTVAEHYVRSMASTSADLRVRSAPSSRGEQTSGAPTSRLVDSVTISLQPGDTMSRMEDPRPGTDGDHQGATGGEILALADEHRRGLHMASLASCSRCLLAGLPVLPDDKADAG